MINAKKKLNILETVNYKNFIIRLAIFFVCCFVAALCYNLFLVKDNIVIGGMSGIAIILKQVFNIDIPLFLNISTLVLFVLSLFFLDIKKTLLTLFGSLSYNYMVLITTPIANNLNIEFSSTFIMILVVSILNGICFGLIYRIGFNTGGSDTILLIMNKYLKIPLGLSGTFFNIFIIGFGLIIFGPTNTVYAIIILIMANTITDNVTLGVRDSKMCFVKSKKTEELEDILINRHRLGVTKVLTKGGIFTKQEDLLLVIIPAEDYYGFKHLIKDIDEKSFLMTIDCYAVSGGFKRQIIPF